MAEPLLRVKGLSMTFLRKAGFFSRAREEVRALDDLNFSINAGETLGIVGESGCGKSTLARCLLRLLTPTAGQIFFAGQDLLALPDEAMRRMRQRMQIVLQNPFSSLSPAVQRLPIDRRAIAHAYGNVAGGNDGCGRCPAG